MTVPILWEGKMPISRIRWRNVSSQEYKLPQNLNSKRSGIWNDLKAMEPWTYDGKLLFLENFGFGNNWLDLDVSVIRFSSLVTTLQTGGQFHKGLGVLGVQCMIFSPSRQHCLIGTRRRDQSYRPGYKAIPGGLLEKGDTHVAPKVSLMREIHEETGLRFRKDVNLVAILGEQNFLAKILLLEAHLDEDSGFSPNQQIDGGDEWEGKLKWIPLAEMKKMKLSKLMEGLAYYHSKP
jgi:8-oxo-dGTP pyrophosphatase MutT (NUDIX family)